MNSHYASITLTCISLAEALNDKVFLQLIKWKLLRGGSVNHFIKMLNTNSLYHCQSRSDQAALGIGGQSESSL